MKVGDLVKILEPDAVALGNCTYGILLEQWESPRYFAPSNSKTWRILCGDRTLILLEEEFEVVK